MLHSYHLIVLQQSVYQVLTQTDNVVDAFDLCPSSSYVVFDSAYKFQFDKYNDVFRFVPCNGDTAGLCAFTDQVADHSSHLLDLTEVI